MGQVLHGSARTTAAVRRAIQHSQESLNQLAQRYDLNPKTVECGFLGPIGASCTWERLCHFATVLGFRS